MSPTLVLVALMLASPPADRDALARARDLYNRHMYDAAIKAAEEARRLPAVADAALLVLARAHLERFRDKHSVADLNDARSALLGVDAAKLSPRDNVEMMIGFGETLYFDGQFGAAAELFDSALTAPDRIEGDARDRLLDWWADAIDRNPGVGPTRDAAYTRMLRRIEEESHHDPHSMVAAYWLVVAARGVGDIDRAWNAAIAGWVRATSANPRAVELRADLDRYVVQVIIPERARRPSAGEDGSRAEALRTEWAALKDLWVNP
jgi:tetratricopeptide (TPR) repeat protein